MSDHYEGTLDPDCVGYRTPEFDVEVEKGRLRLFSKAIGEDNPIYTDEQAARAAGFRAMPVPPTFLFCLEMERDDPYDWFKALNIPLAKVLHGEQAFVYHQQACAGDVLHFSGEVAELYCKRGGSLEFLRHHNWVHLQNGELVAEFDRTLVIRHA